MDRYIYLQIAMHFSLRPNKSDPLLISCFGIKLQVDLSGGYYDAGDNVKFGFPMAFTVTMLSWSAIQYSSQLSKAGELQNVQAAIKWGTDYFLKAHTGPTELWVQVSTII